MNNIDRLIRDLDTLAIREEIKFDVNIFGNIEESKFTAEDERRSLLDWNDRLLKVKIIGTSGSVKCNKYLLLDYIGYYVEYTIRLNNGVKLHLSHEINGERFSNAKITAFTENYRIGEREMKLSIEEGTIGDTIMKVSRKLFNGLDIT